jgi:UDP-glucose 4-epimerase
VIFASSAAVYGNPEYLPLGEAHPTNPISPYGISKLACEKYCYAYSSQYAIDTAIIRIFNTYGPRQTRYVMDDFYHKLKSGSPILQMIGEGMQVRDFCFVTDTVKAFVAVAKNLERGCQLYNVGTGKPTTIRDVANIMISIMAPSVIIQCSEMPWKGDIADLGPANIARLTKLGFSPTIGLGEGLPKLIDWREQGRE